MLALRMSSTGCSSMNWTLPHEFRTEEEAWELKTKEEEGTLAMLALLVVELSFSPVPLPFDLIFDLSFDFVREVAEDLPPTVLKLLPDVDDVEVMVSLGARLAKLEYESPR